MEIPATGILNFESRNQVDQHFQDAFNIIIHLNLQIVAELKRLKEEIKSVVKGKGLEQEEINPILEAINKLSIKESSEQRDLAPKPYIHWKEDE